VICLEHHNTCLSALFTLLRISEMIATAFVPPVVLRNSNSSNVDNLWSSSSHNSTCSDKDPHYPPRIFQRPRLVDAAKQKSTQALRCPTWSVSFQQTSEHVSLIIFPSNVCSALTSSRSMMLRRFICNHKTSTLLNT